MKNRKVIAIGQKESFIIRVLVQKVEETGIECTFVPWTIDDIAACLEQEALVAVLMDGTAMPSGDVIHFLNDKLEENSMKMVVVGETNDIRYICDRVRNELIYATFPRPVDNAKFATAVKEYFSKADLGAFRKSILIVDDDPQYLTMVREWLKDTYRVLMANSGLQAIKLLVNNKADLILLDYEMPVTSGPQVLEMLRSDADTRDIPVMFLTGKGDKDSVLSVVELKPAGYFLKNIQKDELLIKLQEFFILRQ